MDNYRELLFRAQIEAVVTEREMMNWENTIRAQNNQTIAYDEDAFNALISELARIEEAIRNSG